ncbi:MAG TPA: diacylglycerol kinase family protein [Alphaproteobacteria bacterium]|jgi:diacylglycerol kinase family enzyme
MRALVIFNDGAGSAVSKESLQDLLQQQGYEIAWLSSKEVDKLAKRLDGIDIVVAAGGDGTVTKAALQLGSDDPPIGILPLGTANNIANTLGIAGKLPDIAATWAATPPTPLDVWQAKGPWGRRRFIEGCGLGALTQMAHQMDTQDITGHSIEHEIAIARAALLQTLTHAKPVETTITLDEDSIAGEFLMLEMLNFGMVGPRLPLAWSADPFDGCLEVGYALQDDYNALCRWLSAGAEPLSESPITVRRARKIHIRWRDSRFRIGDKYWPSPKQEEPDGKFEAALRLVKHKPNILCPRPPEED